MAVSTTKAAMASTPSVNATLISIRSQHLVGNTRQSLSSFKVVSRSERDCANRGTGAQSQETKQRGWPSVSRPSEDDDAATTTGARTHIGCTDACHGVCAGLDRWHGTRRV